MPQSSGSGATPWLVFLVGGLLVLVLAIGYFAYTTGGGGLSAPSKSINVNIKPPPIPAAPKLPDAPIPTPK